MMILSTRYSGHKYTMIQYKQSIKRTIKMSKANARRAYNAMKMRERREKLTVEEKIAHREKARIRISEADT